MGFTEKSLNFSNKIIARILEDEFVELWTDIKVLAAKSISLYVNLSLATTCQATHESISYSEPPLTLLEAFSEN